jgi:hypothetical protein
MSGYHVKNNVRLAYARCQPRVFFLIECVMLAPQDRDATTVPPPVKENHARQRALISHTLGQYCIKALLSIVR